MSHKTKKTASYAGLLAIMKQRKITQGEMANAIKMPLVTFNLKVNRKNGRDFMLAEAREIAALLNIKIDQFF